MSWFNIFLEARAEILSNIPLFSFSRFEDTEIPFRN